MSEKKETEKLKHELEKAKKEAEEYLNGWKRAKADYLNREKEINREKIDWVRFANLELILKFLPVLDSFYHSLKQVPDDLKDNQWAKGMEQIKQQFENFLRAQGVERIKTIGEKFNPELHEAIEKKGEGGEITEEIQAGYLLNNEVIRASKVVVK